MSIFKLILGIGFFSGLLIINSCKKPCDDPTNPECENYDACIGKKNINTFFKVRHGDRGFPPPKEWCKLIPCDTFYASSVRFDIPDGNPEYCTYEWQIGTESEPRTAKAFEVSFSHYLNTRKWELWIPVTLTIRTPMNECLENPSDTLKTVTRELFFTKKLNPKRNLSEQNYYYKGRINGNPEVSLIEFIFNDTNYFIGVRPTNLLIVGLPNYDTLLYPKCRYEYCNNYAHAMIQFNNETCIEELDFGLASEEIIFSKNNDKITHIWVFNKPTSIERYEFIGERIE